MAEAYAGCAGAFYDYYWEEVQTRMFLEEKIQAAIRRRSGLKSPETDVCRLVNGSGDDARGLIIDDFDGRWLVSVKEGESVPLLSPELGYRSLYTRLLSKDTKASPFYLGGEKLSGRFPVREHGLSYWIDFQSGYSPGLFLDQRLNRRRLRELSPKKTVLNTFAYTCSFGLAAASVGAKTTNLDLSRSYLEWGRENYRLNGVDPEQHDFIYGDVFDWLARFAKRDRHFDIVVLDPPTFSRNRKSEVFRAEDDYGELLESSLQVLNADGILLCCMNTHQVSTAQYKTILTNRLPATAKLRQMSMPEDFSGSDYLKTFWVFL